MTPEELLKQYEDLQSLIDLRTAEKKQLIDALLSPEVRAEIAAIDAEYDDIIAAVEKKADSVAKELRAAVAASGEKVTGQRFAVSYTKPRITWDDKALVGYAIEHPELYAFRREGRPSARIVRKK